MEHAQCGMPNILNLTIDSTISFSYSSSTDSHEIIPKSKAKIVENCDPQFSEYVQQER